VQVVPSQPQALAFFWTPHAVALVKTTPGQVAWVVKPGHPLALTGVACFSTPSQFQSKGFAQPAEEESFGPPV
jgi:hypothetical protein